jgi:hypothetical protein
MDGKIEFSPIRTVRLDFHLPALLLDMVEQ